MSSAKKCRSDLTFLFVVLFLPPFPKIILLPKLLVKWPLTYLQVLSYNIYTCYVVVYCHIIISDLKIWYISFSTGQYKLNGRAFHHTQVIDDSLYLWGGSQPNLPLVHNNDEKRRLTSQLQIFNITSGKWDTKPTRGNPPLGVVRYACTTFNNKIYYFGGWCRHDNCYHNSLNELDTSTLIWTQISPTDDRRPVMKRCTSGMMLTEYRGVHRLLVIGGTGSPPSTKLPQAQYTDLTSGMICTNEQNLYNISTSKYINVSYYTIRHHITIIEYCYCVVSSKYSTTCCFDICKYYYSQFHLITILLFSNLLKVDEHYSSTL